MARKRSLKPSNSEQGWRVSWEPNSLLLLLWANGVDPLAYRCEKIPGEDFRAMSERARKDPDFFPNNTPESRKKVAHMLRLSVELARFVGKHQRQAAKKPQRAGGSLESALRKADELDALFCSYQWERRAGIAIEGCGPQPYSRVRVRDDGTVPEGERLAVEALGDCARAGLLSRFKVCKCGCELWFFESRLGKKFFSDSHRIRAAQSTPEYKEKREKYSKDYYEKYLKSLGKGTSKSHKKVRQQSDRRRTSTRKRRNKNGAKKTR